MGICSSIANASQNLSTNGFAQGLGQVLGVLGAADVAIRVGSGGQAGVLDLPQLLSGTAGIPCYSPELGDFIYVTPTQFWANGGRCDGLRDTNREKIQQQIQEYQDRMDARNRIRQKGFQPPPMYSEDLKELEKLLPDLPDSGFGNGNGIEFLASGTLDMTRKQGNAGFSRWAVRDEPFTMGGNTLRDLPTQKIEIEPGQKIMPLNPTYVSFSNSVFDEVENYTRTKTETYASKYFFLMSAAGAIIGSSALWGYNYSASSSTSKPSFRFVYQVLGGFGITQTKATLSFTPSASPPPTNNGGGGQNTPINPTPPPTPPKETPCMGGCSCGDIAGGMQREINSLKKLVQEIHKAVAASKFTTPYVMAPEQMIESAGKKIYAANFGRAGTTTANNLIEATTALIASEYYRLGLQRFPAKVPDSLIPNPNAAIEAIDRDMISISDMAGFQEWQFKQWNAWSGKWPIEFDITDDGKTKRHKLWNIEHAIAELYSQNLKIVEDADQGVQWGLRATTEASKAGNAALKALHILQELVKLTGAITGQETIKVKSTFTPNLESWQGAGQTTEEMLRSSEQDLVVMDIKDNRTLIGLLLNISFWVQIAGNAVYGRVNNDPATGKPTIPGDNIKADRKKDKQREGVYEKQWDKWKREIQTPSAAATSDAANPPTPNITEIQRPTV